MTTIYEVADTVVYNRFMNLTSLLQGWSLFFDRWEVSRLPDAETQIPPVLEEVKETFADQPLTASPVVLAVRSLFREAGTDPTRYRPSFEALARRILRGDPFPRVHPAVDISNLLSLRWRVPCCVADLSAVSSPVTLRAGRPGETMESLRGPIGLEGKPLLEDRDGPYSTPITDSRRGCVSGETVEVSFVAYFPDGFLLRERVERDLREMGIRGEG